LKLVEYKDLFRLIKKKKLFVLKIKKGRCIDMCSISTRPLDGSIKLPQAKFNTTLGVE